MRTHIDCIVMSNISSQGKIVGIIVPPPEIRAIVDKTAQFVFRNGKSFEERIMNSEEGMTAKFSFLKTFDPYHGYYEQKIREAEDVANGNAVSKSEDSAPEIPVPAVTSSTTVGNINTTVAAPASLITPLARMAQAIADDAPPDLEFTLLQPTGITIQDLDVIKLTAQYTAVNGREFLSKIAQREQRNPQFEFLVPTSLNFNYFTSLVDQYTLVLEKNRSAKTIQQQNLYKKQQRMPILEQAVLRWKWGHQLEEKLSNQLQGEDGDLTVSDAFLIDWSHFTIVETISFDEDISNPSAVTAAQAAAPQFTTSSSSDGVSAHGEVKSDEEDEDMDMDEDEDEDEEDHEIRVSDDYKPTLGSSVLAPQKMMDPLSGKAIGVNAVGEHMRVQLIDPRWRADQQKFQDKQKETGYAAGDTISQNLDRFAKNRADIFGEEVQIKELNAPTVVAPSANPAKRMKM